MRIRRAVPADLPFAVQLARRLSLDYQGLENDAVWVAVEGDRVVGSVALKRHPDCLELVALGVDEAARKKGVGGRLVEALLAAAEADVYLATVSPDYFLRFGFEPVASVPASLAARMGTSWCEGCPRERCTVMVGRSG